MVLGVATVSAFTLLSSLSRIRSPTYLRRQGLSCLASEGTALIVEGCQSTGAMHPWYSVTQGNKFDLASVVKEPVRQTSIVCKITNIDAVFLQIIYLYSLQVWCAILKISICEYQSWNCIQLSELMVKY